MDRRQLLIAGVIAPLAVLIVVLAIILSRGSRAPEPARVTVRDERPPGTMGESDGFRPSVVDNDTPAGDADDLGEPSPPADAVEDEGDAPAPAPADGLEAPPRRAPRPPSSPPTAPRPDTRPAPVARPAHEAFARDYLARQANNAVSDVLGLYATSVRYYSMGRVDAQTVYDDKEAYVRRFPDRTYRLVPPVRVVSSTGTGTATLRFDYDFAAGGGAGGERSGRAWVELDVVPSGDTYLIQGEHGSVY